jgi:SAM-dependent methyltransferase
MTASPLVCDFLGTILEASRLAPVLDLACGRGRNALWLAQQGVPVLAADINRSSLAALREEADAGITIWEVDLEDPASDPLAGQSFGAILVFRYLHRPLIPSIQAATVPGGLVIYETFTQAQAHLGRPTNPDFLLRPGELADAFRGWEHLHTFEGVVESSVSGRPCAVAQLVARKPLG